MRKTNIVTISQFAFVGVCVCVETSIIKLSKVNKGF